MKIYCCKCRKEIEAHLTDGKEIYPHRPDLYSKKFWKCPHCGNYVGCHGETTRPLGCIPTTEVKLARIKVHNKMDPLWKSGLITRTKLYRLISKELGYTYHNGSTKTVQECLKVWDIVDSIEKELKHDWQY